VETHRGFIKAHPNAEKGATFIIHLPLEEAAE
jgi:signal transduction histidine kinase